MTNLRALRDDDLERLRSFVNDPEVMRYSNHSFHPVSQAEQQAWWQRTKGDPTCAWFGIDVDGALVGSCCLVDIDMIARVAELRVRIGVKELWGRGVGTEACRLLLVDAFGPERNLNRVWLRVYDSNPRAIRVYEKLGFVVEGRLRQSALIDGALRDTIVMGLLRSEWDQGNKT